MNPFEMVVAIIVIVTIGSVLKARYGIRKDQWGNETHIDEGKGNAENARLKEEVRGLKDRVQVLERVITDTNDSSARLDREIESLRDKN
ncbi:MAG: hypothetical protein EOP62_17645 [Sphingomonadales bacterium]|nr:MAG: hypothetical protein EOP62_17645 [Sphingomonadales bacterium]